MATTRRKSEDKSEPCALRALNICDGALVDDREGHSLWDCFCDSEQMLREVGWTGAAETHAKLRSEVLASSVLHPAGKLRRS